ncbi:hypothetical protein ANFP_24330 [Acidithiobacillus ferrooxidans]|nr:hypothetical protein ANFP_24330 [Acidithiobacillus ferrooxidans]
MGSNQAEALACLQPREFNQALTRKGTADQPGQAHLNVGLFSPSRPDTSTHSNRHAKAPILPYSARKGGRG